MNAPLRVILVRPHYPANVGSAARVMRNFGHTDLRLVAPVADLSDPAQLREARRLSTHGQAILDDALAAPGRVVATLPEALVGCEQVVATSASTAGLFRGQSSGTTRSVLARVARALADAPGTLALVFGPEPSGLTNSEVSLCHWLAHVPTSSDYPALNLAQAVAVCLYEWNEARLALSGDVPEQGDPAHPGPAHPRDRPASWEAQDRLFASLREGLESVHFLYDGRADALMHAIRHLISRAGPTAGEVGILHGLARQLRWAGARLPRPTNAADAGGGPATPGNGPSSGASGPPG